MTTNIVLTVRDLFGLLVRVTALGMAIYGGYGFLIIVTDVVYIVMALIGITSVNVGAYFTGAIAWLFWSICLILGSYVLFKKADEIVTLTYPHRPTRNDAERS